MKPEVVLNKLQQIQLEKRFLPGTKIRIGQEAPIGKGRIYWNPDMVRLLGKELEIIRLQWDPLLNVVDFRVRDPANGIAWVFQSNWIDDPALNEILYPELIKKPAVEPEPAHLMSILGMSAAVIATVTVLKNLANKTSMKRLAHETKPKAVEVPFLV